MLLAAISMLAFCIIAISALATPALALVDLLNPIDGGATNATTLTFEYYASVPALTGCTLAINGNTFIDPDAQSNAINSVTVQAMTPGAYSWNVSCTDGTNAETSITRALLIDTQSPTIAVMAPTNNSTAPVIPVDIIPYDDGTASLTCEVIWNGMTLDTVPVVPNTRFARNYTPSPGPAPGNGTVRLVCTDRAGNAAAQTRAVLYQPVFAVMLTTDRSDYAINDPVRLTVDTINGANVSIDICPDQTGFVQCTTALLGSNEYPQAFTLPYMNKTGSYIVEAAARYGNVVRINRTRYTIANSLTVQITMSGTQKINGTINLTAVPSNGVAPYRIRWNLTDGTIVSDASTVAIKLNASGSFTHRVMVTDAANNTRNETYTYTIEPLVPITVRVIEKTSGQPIVGADVSLDGNTPVENAKTVANGIAYLQVEPGDYRLFASASGYNYGLEDITVNDANNLPYAIALTQNALKPAVTLLSPSQGNLLESPVTVSFRAQHPNALLCTLYTSTDGSWFAPNTTVEVNNAIVGVESSIIVPFQLGSYTVRVECTDATDASRTGASPTVGFEVTAVGDMAVAGQSAGGTSGSTTSPTKDELRMQEAIAHFEALLQSIESYGQREKEAVLLLGYDRDLRNAKRAAQQAVRDINDLQYRQEYDDAGREQERKRIAATIEDVLAKTPQSLSVKDTKSFVRYIEEDDVEVVSTELAGLGGLAADPRVIARKLLDDQQQFTISTKAMHVDYAYIDGTTKSLTVLTRSFTYAKDISPDYAVYEIIPKEVVTSARDLTIIGKAEILKDDPVLRFGAEQSFTYIIPRRVDMTRVEDIKTVLLRPYAGESGLLTGFAIFGAGDTAALGTPAVIVLIVVVLAYLVYYFDLFKHVRYLVYRIGKKGKLHYMRVLIGDADDNLAAGDYEKASMLYKELRLTYDTLPPFAKNELYDEIAALLAKMDAYYFNTVMLELDGHMKAGDLESAILAYEKLTGIYTRLGPKEQANLATVVSALGRRIGAGVTA